jgi:hypothetical protein
MCSCEYDGEEDAEIGENIFANHNVLTPHGISFRVMHKANSWKIFKKILSAVGKMKNKDAYKPEKSRP